MPPYDFSDGSDGKSAQQQAAWQPLRLVLNADNASPPSTADSAQSDIAGRRRSRIRKNDASPGARPTRQAAPVQSLEERSQQLDQQHREQMRLLAVERQVILTRQQHIPPSPKTQGGQDAQDAAARRARRMEVIAQLADEEVAARAALDALKQGQSILAARQIGAAKYQEQQIKKQGASEPLVVMSIDEPNTPQQQQQQRAASRGMTQDDQAKRTMLRSPLLEAPVTKSSTPPPVAASQQTRAADASASQPGVDASPSQTAMPSAPSRAGAAPPSTATRQTPQAPAPLSPATGQAPTPTGREAAAAAAPSSPTASARRAPAPSAPPVTPSPPPSSGNSRHDDGRDVVPSAPSAAARSPASQGPPSEVEQLKEQIKALQAAVETQMNQSNVAAMQQQAAAAASLGMVPTAAAFQQMMLMAAMAQQQQQQQATPVDKNAVPGLPPELQQDAQLRAMHAEHVREMTVLRMEIDRAKTATELAQIKAMLGELRDKQNDREDHSFSVPPTPLSPPASFQSDDEEEEDEAPAPVAHGIRDEDEIHRLAYENEFLDQTPQPGDVPMEPFHGDAVQIKVNVAGPFLKEGSYRLRVVLYDGYQPVETRDGTALGTSTRRCDAARKGDQLIAEFNETLLLRGFSLTPTMVLILELHVARKALLGMPTKEQMVAWAVGNLSAGGKIIAGAQNVPLYRQPLMLTAQRKFSYESAMLGFSLKPFSGNPNDVRQLDDDEADLRSASGRLGPAEDVPGVPTEAWMRVARGVPPADPYVPGDGFVVIVDGARFLPLNCTISKVVGNLWSNDKRQLTSPFQAVSLPASDAFMPLYEGQSAVGTGTEKFDDATACILFTVFTIDKYTRTIRAVGYALLNAFVDPKNQAQPTTRKMRDYVLNAGSFQLPLHVLPPRRDRPCTVTSLDDTGRVPCASILVRVMTSEAARMERRQPVPVYKDRIYDSMRAIPTPVERKLFVKYLSRPPFACREAAHFLATERPPYERKPGAEYGHEVAEIAPFVPTTLPSSDAELLQWMEKQLYRPKGMADVALNYNYASEYCSDLGFLVAVDGATRLGGDLPAAAIITFAPPGSLYQDVPLAHDVKVTLKYDLNSFLSMPVWMDGYQHFKDVAYEPGMAVIIDVRVLVPSTGVSAPAGWAVLPLFEPLGPYVASGWYHLPLFQGIPNRALFEEWASRGDVEDVISEQIKAGRLKAHSQFGGVLVRLLDAARVGQQLTPATAVPTTGIKLPIYLDDLGKKYVFSMRKQVRDKTYISVKPWNMTEDVWVAELNDAILKVAGLDTDEDELLEQQAMQQHHHMLRQQQPQLQQQQLQLQRSSGAAAASSSFRDGGRLSGGGNGNGSDGSLRRVPANPGSTQTPGVLPQQYAPWLQAAPVPPAQQYAPPTQAGGPMLQYAPPPPGVPPQLQYNVPPGGAPPLLYGEPVGALPPPPAQYAQQQFAPYAAPAYPPPQAYPPAGYPGPQPHIGPSM